MKNILDISLLLIAAYLIGAIPTSVWVGKIFFNKDVRDYGSGNAGATNVMRTFGPFIGIPVLLIDIFKGFMAVKFLNLFPSFIPGSNGFVNLQIGMGIVAIVGHIFPIYAQFRGGKGVATIFGVLLALSPFATLCAGGIFLLVLLISKYVSVSSITAGLSFPVWIIVVFQTSFISLGIFSGAVAFLIIFTHRKNINRLINGKENKAGFLFKEKKSVNR